MTTISTAWSRFRVLVVPGLHDSGTGHWQTRWQALYPGFERVQQDDWSQPDLPRWSARLDELRARDPRPTLLVAHSFGCLTAVHSIRRDLAEVAGVLLVAPADPAKFGVSDLLPMQALPCPAIMVASSDDPWMRQIDAALWAQRWGSEFVAAGACGHINAESGLGDWPEGQRQLARLAALAQAREATAAPGRNVWQDAQA